jgi:hypothetical protein
MNKKILSKVGWAICLILFFVSMFRHGFTVFHLIFALFLGATGRVLWGGPPQKLIKKVKDMTPPEQEAFLSRLDEDTQKAIRQKIEAHDA